MHTYLRCTQSKQHQDQTLYLAIRDKVYWDFFAEKIAQIAVRRNQLKLLVFDERTEEVVQWIE